MKVLHLTLKKKWFDMIASGEKKEEYREWKPYWAKRLTDGLAAACAIHAGSKEGFKKFDIVRFANGGNFHPSRPQIKVKCLGVSKATGKPEWGAQPGKEYFVIKLGELIK